MSSNRPRTGVPRIRRGEIKNVKSYGKALNQLAQRPDVAGNTALALYDDAGNIHLQVFAKDPSGVRQRIYDRPVGRVPVPAGVRPGTAPFGNAIEALILALLGRLTGQSFRPKRSNAGGPDILGEVLGEWERETSAVSPAVSGFVRAMRAAARSWAGVRGSAKERASRRGYVITQMRPMLAGIATMSPREIDLILGVLTEVERYLGGNLPDIVRNFRRAALTRRDMNFPPNVVAEVTHGAGSRCEACGHAM
jgi:hypothetical protein